MYMSQGKVKATIYLPDDVHHRLKLRAVEERSSMTELVLQAIEELLARPAMQQATAEVQHNEHGTGQEN